MADKSVYCVDVFDKDGNLTKIEAFEFGSGDFVIQFLWDENDEQTNENRIEFRKWVSRHLKQIGHNLIGS
jgi:hypothetical protein